MFFFWILVSLIVSVSGLPPLRKHHSHLQSGVDEADVIQPRQNLSLLFSTDASICGVASLSCMAFSSSSSEVPVRCGILTKAPVCQSYDPGTQESKCDTFCDADGSGRLCEKAFPDCCKESTNGCTSSQPRDITLYH